jgi:glucuronokinase
MPQPVTARALPRAALLGNPSDGYGGRVIAFPFADFRAEATVTLSSAGDRSLAFCPGTPDEFHAPGWEAAFEALREGAVPGEGARLLTASLARFAGHCVERGLAGASELPGLSVEFRSDIPRQVGLAGSSAVVIATLRALSRTFEVELDPPALADLALRAETEELGITAGPQDRVVQAEQAPVFMEFGGAPRVEHLDAALLPPLLLAWTRSPGNSSGTAHEEVRARFERGDEAVVSAMLTFARLAAEGLEHLRAGRRAALMELVNENFDTRAAIWPLAADDRALVELGRAHGAATKLTGSGGAVLAVVENTADLPALRDVFEAAGFAALIPQIVS